MHTKITELTPQDKVPDGVYDGIWGGYVVTFSVNGINYEAKTEEGIRTPAAKCRVISTNGKLTVQA